ncbi:MAG: hypothetical protein Q8P07_00250 [bacterium]|nr:hypothetical protein [bacterium]
MLEKVPAEENSKEEFKDNFKYRKEHQSWVDLPELVNVRDTTSRNLHEKFPQDISKMRAIYEKNYQAYPPKFINKLLRSFDEAISNPETVWFIVKHRDQLAAFLRHENRTDKKDGKPYFYFGAFNTNPDYKSAKLGESLLDHYMMDARSTDIPIRADCDANSLITKKYIKMGFIAKDVYDYEGVPSFSIELDDELNKLLVTKKLPLENVKDLAMWYKEDFVVNKYTKTQDPDFDLLNHGFLLTQFFGEDNYIYTVFEKDPRAKEMKIAA